MRKLSTKKSKPRWETHVRLTASEKKAVEAIAEREARSVTAQIALFVRQGLATADA